MTDKIDKTKQKEQTKKILIILGLLAGAALIILSFFTPANKNNSANNNTKNDLTRIDTESYIAGQEKKLCDMLNKINGVSDAYVMITLNSSSEYIYASKESIKESSSKDGDIIQRDVQKDIVLHQDENKAESPILIKEIQPKIKGVAVVCKGDSVIIGLN